MADVNAVELTMAQRIAACKIIAGEINAAGNGLAGEVWTTASPKPGVGISVLNDGNKFAIVTVNGKGYYNIRSFLEGTEPTVLAKLEPFGFTPGKFTLPVSTYGGPGKRFDTSKLAK